MALQTARNEAGKAVGASPVVKPDFFCWVKPGGSGAGAGREWGLGTPDLLQIGAGVSSLTRRWEGAS